MHRIGGETRISLFDTPIPPLPRPPSPSADAGIAPGITVLSPEPLVFHELDVLDVFKLKSLVALQMLCTSVEALMKTSNDSPSSLPVVRPSIPPSGPIARRKENVALYDRKGGDQMETSAGEDDDGVPVEAKTLIGSPDAHPTEPLRIIGANMEPFSLQHDAISRKFYSKKPPPIALEEYLLRLHRFCPMSTAVYLATSMYIYRLAVIEKTMLVTVRNVHRLMLAGLRVAMKALEDHSYPHRRFAKVGGVSEPELARLEISFCFVTNFELKVDEAMLVKHAKAISNEKMTNQSLKG